RKIVSQGHSAGTITLPVDWMRMNGLKKGDEVFLEDRDSQLLILCKPKIHKRTIEVDLRKKDSIITKVLSILYMAGFDEISIKFTNESSLKRIQAVIKDYFSSFDIVEYKKDACRIKSLSEPSKDELDNALKRVSQLLSSQISHVEQCLLNSEFNLLSGVDSIEESINRTTVFYRRLINKNYVSRCKNNIYLFLIMKTLESAGDELKFLTQHILRLKIKRCDKEVAEVFGQINSFADGFYSSYKDVGWERFQTVYDQRKRIIDRINQAIKKLPKNQCIILMYAASIVQRIYEAYNYLFSLNL
ncbi:hypothetical protein JXA85_02415, partial [Candidatus Woesearchaeota archaeon]|nr:hypothetical protein [Candidatus Woesearchaeota archaeon]